MSKSELNEQQAISRLVARKQSAAYQHAVEANIPVTYVAGTDIVCEQDGQKIVIAHVRTSTKLQTPRIYSLK